MDSPNLDRIAEAKSAYSAWEVLRKQCQGTSKVLSIRIEALRQSFETLQMEDSEGIQDYISHVLTIVNQIRAFGHKLSEPEVVSKVLRSLAPKFDFIAMAIEELKEIAKLTLDDLSGTRQAHEVRVNPASSKTVEKALHVNGEPASINHSKGGSLGNSWGEGRGRGRAFGPSKGRGRGGRGRSSENKSQVQWFHCRKFGHVKADCWVKNKQPERRPIWLLKNER